MFFHFALSTDSKNRIKELIIIHTNFIFSKNREAEILGKKIKLTYVFGQEKKITILASFIEAEKKFMVPYITKRKNSYEKEKRRIRMCNLNIPFPLRKVFFLLNEYISIRVS